MALVTPQTATTVRQGVKTIPAPFVVTRTGSGSVQLTTRPSYNVLDLNGVEGYDELLEGFASLLGPTRPGSRSVSVHDTHQYLQSLDLYKKYENRTVDFLGKIMDAAILNSRANFLSTVCCPVWMNQEMNYTVTRREGNAMLFTRVSPHGIPEEQSHFEYGWSSSVEPAKLQTKIDRDLSLDPNYGMEVWLQELSWFASNAMLTVNANVIYGLMTVGWQNIVQAHSVQVAQNWDHMLQEEGDNFLIAPLDSERCLAKIRNKQEKIPTFDTVITAGGTMRYFRDIQGESITVPAQRPWSNPRLQDVEIDIYDGPRSYKTVMLGDQRINFFELMPFVQNTQNPNKHQPLTRRVAIGQFHPPSPRLSPHDPVHSNDPNQHTIMLYYQEPTNGMLKPVTLRDRLIGCNAYDRRGNVAREVHEFVSFLNHPKNPDEVPWPWNHANLNRDHDNDINNDTQDLYGEPNLAEVSGKQNLHDMRSFRAHPCFIAYDPRDEEFYVPQKILGFMLSALTNAQLHQAAKYLALRLRNKTCRDDLDAAFYAIDQIIATFRDAEWTDTYVEALIDKNIRRIVKRNGAGWELDPHKTSEEKRRHFRGANRIEEFRGNADGVLDLPDKEARVLSVTVPPGYAFGAGFIYLAREARKPQSLWKDVGQLAEKVVKFFGEILQVTRENIHPEVDSIRAKNAHEWVQKDDALAVLIDAYVQPEGPIFLGVPPSVRIGESGPSQADLPTSFTATNWEQAPGKARDDIDTIIDVITRQPAGVTLTRIMVSAKDRVYVCLSGSSEIDRLLMALLATKYSQPVQEQVDRVLAAILKTAGYHEKPTAKRTQYAHALAVAAMRGLGEGDTDVAREKKLATLLDETQTQSKAKQALDRLVEKIDVAFDAGKTSDAINALRVYESKYPIPSVIESGRKGAQDKTEKEQREAIRQGSPSEYAAEYDEHPRRYLRAPLAATEELRRYIASKSTDRSYVLPGSVIDNFEAPESFETVRDKINNPPADTTTMSEKDATTLSMPFMFSGLRPLMARFNARSGGSGGDDDEYGSSASEHEDLFAPLRRPSPSSSFSVTNMLQFGTLPGDRDYGRRATRQGYVSRLLEETDVTEIERITMAMKQEHRGPAIARVRYMKDEIQSPAERFFFRLILEAPNVLQTLVNLAGIGARLFDVMTVRPWITAETNMMVVMAGGAGTSMYGVGHSTIQVTKEQRGIFTMGCGFWHGFIPINPDAIDLLLNVTPHAFIGGKKLDYMKEAKDWAIEDPTAKPSMIGFLIPTHENKHRGYMHVRNEGAYVSPDQQHAKWEAKCSAFGQWYDFLYQHYKPESIDARWHTRRHCHARVPVAHNVSLGPTIYMDPRTGKEFDIEGVGPSGSRRMNVLQAYATWNGLSHRFPDPMQYALSM